MFGVCNGGSRLLATPQKEMEETDESGEDGIGTSGSQSVVLGLFR